MAPVAFYAPLKPPFHAVPSGDREMARLFMRLLREIGHHPQVASTLRSHDAAGDPDLQARLAAEGALEVERLRAAYRGLPASQRPALWFTYHLYYKAPDLIGPAVSRALAIPYVVAEGSRAGKRRTGRWRRWHARAEAALDAADLVVTVNPADEPALVQARPPGQDLVVLPPFLDPAEWPFPPRGARETTGDAVRLLAVAMMREGDKLASYTILATALAALRPRAWSLDIVGDGPARGAVEALFAPFGAKVAFRGQVDDRASLANLYAGADLLAWPAVNEAFGMVFLEAAWHGCPALAGDYGGVRGVVLDGRTGLVVPPGDATPFADAAAALMADPALLDRLGEGAYRFARHDRSLEAAARHLALAIQPLLTQPGWVG